jgi:hypothetical protein
MREFVLAIFSIFVILIILAFAGTSDFTSALRDSLDPSRSPRTWHVETDCPLEDSCYVDYNHGEWFIIEGERP